MVKIVYQTDDQQIHETPRDAAIHQACKNLRLHLIQFGEGEFTHSLTQYREAMLVYLKCHFMQITELVMAIRAAEELPEVQGPTEEQVRDFALKHLVYVQDQDVFSMKLVRQVANEVVDDVVHGSEAAHTHLLTSEIVDEARAHFGIPA